MPIHELSRVSRYSARQMFDLVADVEAYDEFLPLIGQSSIYDLETSATGVSTFKGRLQVKKDSIKINETFISDVTTDENTLTVVSKSSGGPLERLINIWSFSDLPDGGSKSKMVLEYEISNFALRLVMKASYDLAMTKLTDAFEKRADKLYG